METNRIIYTRETDEDTFELEVTYRFMPGTSDYFCPTFGNWLPGDPAEFEVLSARVRVTGLLVELTQAEEDEIEEEVGRAYEEKRWAGASEDRMTCNEEGWG